MKLHIREDRGRVEREECCIPPFGKEEVRARHILQSSWTQRTAAQPLVLQTQLRCCSLASFAMYSNLCSSAVPIPTRLRCVVRPILPVIVSGLSKTLVIQSEWPEMGDSGGEGEKGMERRERGHTCCQVKRDLTVPLHLLHSPVLWAVILELGA